MVFLTSCPLMVQRVMAAWERYWKQSRQTNHVLRRRFRKSRDWHGMQVLLLEPRAMLSAAFPEFVDPHPNAGNQFGATVVPLSTGNVVITAPYDDAGGTDAGAVYLFNGSTGALISTLTGSHAYDNIGVGGVTALSNGNYVVRSYYWDNGSATKRVR